MQKTVWTGRHVMDQFLNGVIFGSGVFMVLVLGTVFINWVVT